ncbi:hypothetical protein [Streptomyces tsukubensis]|uniref:hypothetical protein n=1 Tax=Streptomyces tsukubensis TaxID=83656 RepID=UPI00344B7A66
MSENRKTPSVGDEVEEGRTIAIVTDIRGGVVWLRPQGRGAPEWPAEKPESLRIRRTRVELIAAGDL